MGLGGILNLEGTSAAEGGLGVPAGLGERQRGDRQEARPGAGGHCPGWWLRPLLGREGATGPRALEGVHKLEVRVERHGEE